jgi:CRP-like cAMP-binding protein
VIARGHVAVRATTQLGDIATFRVLGPGEIFGEQALLVPDARRVASAIALETLETHTLHRDEFELLRKQHQQIDRFLVEALVLQVRRLSDHLQEALFVPAETRVLRRVVEISASYPSDQGKSVIPLTQDDIASLAGTSRPTANRVLKAAEEDGLVAIGRRRIEVLDADGLAARAR